MKSVQKKKRRMKEIVRSCDLHRCVFNNFVESMSLFFRENSNWKLSYVSCMYCSEAASEAVKRKVCLN